VDVVVTVATARVATVAGMLVRARRVLVLLAVTPLSCKSQPSWQLTVLDLDANLYTAVVVSDVVVAAAALPLRKRIGITHTHSSLSRYMAQGLWRHVL